MVSVKNVCAIFSVIQFNLDDKLAGFKLYQIIFWLWHSSVAYQGYTSC